MNRRIKVMRVIARMNVGGPAMQVAGLTKFLPENEFEQRVFAGDVSEDEADFVKLHGLDVDIFKLGSSGRGFNSLRDAAVLLDLSRKIREFRPDVVHSHTAKAGVLARLAVEISGVTPKRVHTYHGHLLTGYFSPLTLSAVLATEKLLAARTNRLVTVGVQVRDELLAKGVGRRSQYSVIPPGLASVEPVARDDARRRLALGADEFVVLFMGRLTGIKRVDRLLAAVSLAQSRISNLRVIVAGDGELRASLAAQAESSELPVQFLGWRSDVEVLLGAADCVVLTSDNEGTPVSLIQAAQAGVPVVSTNVGSVSEVVEANSSGLLTGLDPKEIAEALVQLAHDGQLRARLGAAGKSADQGRFSYQRLANDHADLYRELMGGPGR